jgi:[acyl-carrier-protein] S-malonyltransferase
MDAIAAQRVSAVLEIGPGQALARMWQDRHAEVPARSADEFRSAPAIAAWLERHAGLR